MSKTTTNSNSMTSLLTVALNNKKCNFRDVMLKCIESIVGKNISDDVCFYDETHQSLPYEEMDGKEIDIIARVPGKRTPVLMIEVKVGVGEILQKSQKEGGQYDLTSKAHGIPLLYIIPQDYYHRGEIPARAEILDWEDILAVAREHDNTYFAEQIEHFVELSEEDEVLSKEEVALLTVQPLLEDVYTTKNQVLDEIRQILEKHGRESIKPQFDQYGVGYYYNYDGNECFIGFNPCLEGERFLTLCIGENASTDKDDKLYYEYGYYYVPVLGAKCVEGDKEVLTDLRKALKEKKIVISKSFEKSLRSFYTLRAKVANLAAAYAEGKPREPYPKTEDGDDKGFCFGESDSSDYFLGLSFEHSIFSLDIRQDLVDTDKCKDLLPNGTYYAFLLSDQKSLFNDFLLSATGEELQKNFNALVDAAKKEADKYRK